MAGKFSTRWEIKASLNVTIKMFVLRYPGDCHGKVRLRKNKKWHKLTDRKARRENLFYAAVFVLIRGHTRARHISDLHLSVITPRFTGFTCATLHWLSDWRFSIPFDSGARAISVTMGRIYLEHIGGRRLFTCAQCDTFLTNRNELISTRFTGATGRAFLFNKVVNLHYR